MNILVFGAQGSGKSTHAKYIAEVLGVPYVYTGDLFRALETEDSPRGREIKKLMMAGILIPDHLAVPAFSEYLKKFDITKGVVLDGFPRNLNQVLSLPFKIDLIIYIDLPGEVAIQRLISRGRYDDTKAAIRKRLTLYERQTRPVLDYFRHRGVKTVAVDNTPPVGEVQRKIDDILENEKRVKNNG